MPKKYHKPEEIVSKLRQVDVLTSQGSTVADAIRQDAILLARGGRNQAAVALLAYLKSDAARNVIVTFGYGLPD